MKRRVAYLAASALAFALVGADEGARVLSLATGTTYSILERYNLSRYENGKYVGHVYRQTRAVIEYDGTGYDGKFYVLEETTRDAAMAAMPIDAVVPASFSVDRQGFYVMRGEDRGFPDWRDFPTFVKDPVKPGDRWRAFAVVTVDPDRSMRRTRIKVFVEYEYLGVKDYRGAPAIYVRAKFATRYKSGQDPLGNPEIVSADGTHDVEIVIDEASGELLIMTDVMHEEYAFAGGRKIAFKGTGFIIFKARPKGFDEEDRQVEDRRIADDVRDKLEERGVKDVVVTEDSDGVRLTMLMLRFKPDSDELLPGEDARLDAIAAALKAVPTGTFLVEGHTADVGMPEHELDLSKRRAKRVVDELVKRGIPSERFIYMGWGATKPVAPNDSEANRALNRRVEITILPDR